MPLSNQTAELPRGSRVRDFSLPELGRSAPAADSNRPVEEGGFIPIYRQERSENPLETAQRQAYELMASAQGQAQGDTPPGPGGRFQTGYQSGLEEGIVALVHAAVERILLSPDAVDPALIRRVVREAVSRANQAERVAVRLNPDDLERVREFRPKLLEGMGRLKYLYLIADGELRPGDYLVEGPHSQVDATMATRRQRIFSLLEETYHPPVLAPGPGGGPG